MSRQEYFREKYRLLRPEWRDCLKVYIEKVDKEVGPESRVLDVGCGHADWLSLIYARTPNVYGVDPDAEALSRNDSIKHKHVSTADRLPFPDDAFDLVTSAFVLEHLENPQKTFREISRVLAPGGKFIFLTPNAWNYNVWLIRAIPEKFHDFFTRKLYGRGERDTYPKYYRANTPRKIVALCRASGLKLEEMALNGDPTYVGLNRPLFWFAVILERILDLGPFNKFRVHMIGTLKK